jgi:hypothetical protein
MWLRGWGIPIPTTGEKAEYSAYSMYYDIYGTMILLSLFLFLQVFISMSGSTLILDGKSMYFCEDVLSGFIGNYLISILKGQ